MFRYIAMTWDAALDSQCAAVETMASRIRTSRQDWRIALQAPGLLVYCGGTRAGASDLQRLGDDGVVLGTVFTGLGLDPGAAGKATFGPREIENVLATQGRSLVDNYWGRYVAFLVDRPGRRAFVLRSPTGELDCLSATIHGVQVYFSGTEHCPLLDQTEIRVNWDYVAAEISTMVQECRETGIVGVQRVLHGECWEVAGDSIERRRYWHPFRFVNADPIEDPAEAAAALHSTARACVHAWASCHGGILGLLSGGLDSSIVVSLLRSAPSRPRVACLNYRNRYDLHTDERRYARQVAEHVGCPIVEHEQGADFSLRPLLDLPRFAAPWFTVFEVGNARHRSDVARAYGASAYFVGHGGDQLFFQAGAEFICTDFIRAHGLRPRLVGIAKDAAWLRGSTVWAALKHGIAQTLHSDSHTPVLQLYEFSPLISADVVDAVRARRLYLPAVCAGPERITTGKFWHVLSLAVQEDMYSPCGGEDEPEAVHPLLSQPLQELCLRIPSYVLSLEGESRGLARVAFEGEVPRAILRRQTKGSYSAYPKAILTHNLSFVTELLLDGQLVKERIVDRPKLERALARDFSTGLGTAANLLRLVSAEAWLHTWSGRHERMAA